MPSHLALKPAGLIFLALVGVGGCDRCDRPGPPVPFRLDAGRSGAASSPSTDPASVADDPGLEPQPITRSLPDGTNRVDVEGAPILMEASIRALWAHDLDGDGDRDAILLVDGPHERPASLVFSRREGTTFAAATALATLPPAAEECRLESGGLELRGETWLLARARIRCPEGTDGSSDALWLIDTRRTPRVLESLAALSPTATVEGELTLEANLEDRDEDGRDDIVVTARLGEVSVALPWLDRTSGLGRDPSEPERTLAGRARVALRALRRRPSRAREEAETVMRLWTALCRESGAARLRVGRSTGLPCGRSEGAGRAAATAARGLAREGRVLEALDALNGLEREGLAIGRERLEAVQADITQASEGSQIQLRSGPAHTPPRWGSARRSALAFLTEDHLLLRGPRARVWDLSSGEETSYEGEEGDLRLLDPTNTFAVAGIGRDCAGHHLLVVPASGLVAGTLVAPPRSPPAALEVRPPPAGAGCPDTYEGDEHDDGGWRLLGWAPQGVVAMRGGTVRLVPLDLGAAPLGPPTEIAPGTPPPTPIAPGAASRDLRFAAEIRGLGVLVHRITPTRESSLFWPTDWAETGDRPSDPAVSPSGRRVAVVRDGRVVVLSRATTSAVVPSR